MKSMSTKQPGIAVVSMAGIFPGAPDTGRFITNILEKKESIVRVPEHRWAAPAEVMVTHTDRSPIPDRAASDRAGLITDFHFDPHGLEADREILDNLDPMHHLVLSACREAVGQCSLPPDLKKRTGVILAAIALPTALSTAFSREIYLGSPPAPLSRANAFGATVVSAPAAIAAGALGLKGGSFTLDAACASSLFAIKLACEHLVQNRADAMVAGGVSRPDSLYTQVGFTQLQALSPTGRCAPFDKNADGLVVGEGTGLVVLKRLDDALVCGDPIHGVITGWGVSNDIEGNLVAPASEGQVRAMTAAYDMAGWSPGDLQYMECHGSGTPKGDQVELASITTLRDRFQCRDIPLSIGSVKSSVGHLLTAAGAAGFIKTLMAMDRKTLPPSLNYTRAPDNSPLQRSAIRVQSDSQPWEGAGDAPRRAGVSAFGFGGINAHLLVEEFRPATSAHAVPATLPSAQQSPPVPCAIVGMAALSGAARDLDDLKDLVFGETKHQPAVASQRWRRTAHLDPATQDTATLFMDTLGLDLKEFHIPPKQMADILPQHLVMLKAARGALADAGIRPRPDTADAPRYRTGCAIGIDFDFGATDFYLRWHLHELPPDLLDQICPGLSFDRTLGALGGIVASRVAREFKLGGPCFTLSAGAASGIKAVETAVQSLGSGETDLFLCGAVDLAGDIRSFTLNHTLDNSDDTHVPSEGAAAIVLKPLDRALEDQDRIYGVINATGSAGGVSATAEPLSDSSRDAAGIEEMYAASLEQALTRTNLPLEEMSLVSVQGSPTGTGGRAECTGIASLSKTTTGVDTPESSLPVFCPAAVLGDTGAASGMFSMIAAALCLYHGRKPSSGTMPGTPAGADSGMQHAAVGSLTSDGASAHVILSAQTRPDQIPGKDNAAEYREQKAPGIIVPVTRPKIPEDLVGMISDRYTAQKVAIKNAHTQMPFPALADPDLLGRTQGITARAHEKFLALSSRNMAEMGKQMQALANVDAGGPAPLSPDVFLDRDKCLEYAVGKAGNVLGPDFDIIDTYPVRVRLPDEPLMLVDRIMEIQGKPLSLGPGKIITQHDVRENAWYLDGGKAPVSISIEAGQADLFLCAYLGIDHKVKGSRKYRLLDARVTFHRSLPSAGETIEYHIEIERFLRQGDIYLFFFHYKGYIDGRLLISMRDGCAGFFTEDEVKNSGGIILKKEDRQQETPAGRVPALVPMETQGFTDAQVDALRHGNLETAFGPAFKGVVPGRNQWLPDGRMTLIHRVLTLAPQGGRFGLGRIVAEADIHPDDWFLTCHFIDDMVMPGTLMYECCAHTLRVFVQRMGWVSPSPEAHYDVLPGNESDLKCRGPVTPETRKARYDIEIKEMGYGPEPYIIADAHMFSDDLRIVLYKDMGMKLAGTSQQELLDFWSNR